MKFGRHLIHAEPWSDIVATICRPHAWIHMGHMDLKQRYRDSVIGPWWICIQTGVTLTSVGYVYSEIFHAPLAVYIPYLTIGLTLWYYTATSLSEGCNALIESAPILKQVRFPIPAILLRVLYRNFLILLHNIPLVIGVLVFYRPQTIGLGLEALLGFAIYLTNIFWLGILLAIMGLRFRDMPQILSALLGLLMLVTPIFWDVSVLARPIALVEYNFFHHLISVVRAPLLGHSATSTNWAWALVGSLTGWIITLLLYKRTYLRLAYWI